MNFKYQKKEILLGVIILFNSFVAYSQSIKEYHGDINIDINKREVQATFEIRFNSFPRIDTIKLFLHQSANISGIYSHSNSIQYKELKEQFIGEDKAIVINREEIQNEKLAIKYTYSLDSIRDESFLFNKSWLELNLYTAWFPLNMDYGLFEYKINVQIPPEYKLISSGVVSENGTFWQVNQKMPSFDIPIIISPQFKCISVAEEIIKVYYLDLNSENEKIIKNIANSDYDFLNKILGKSNTASLILAINQFNRPISYTRKGFISLTVENLFSLQDDKTLAHEIGHLWWNKASVSDWEDWLNEGFAEYSSILILRNKNGEEYFEKAIKELKNTISDLPSIYQLRKENTINQNVITYKGAYLLYKLENRIGRKDFSNFLRTVHQKNIKQTSDFLQLAKDELGTEVESYLESELKK
jgi:hypothetical protein